MTTDIVEWLLSWETPRHKEAADEIERLRAALQKIIDDADSDDGATAWDGSEIARAALGDQ